MSPVTETVIRAVVSEALQDEEPPRWIALHAEPSWTVEPTFEVDGQAVRVVPCISVLAVREVLSSAPDDDSELTVLLTSEPDRELGSEVLARVWRQQVRSPTGWESLKRLFRINSLDAALASQRWLVDLLVAVAPTRGYPPPPGGMLTRDDAWRAFLKHGLRMGTDSPSLSDVLRWAASDDARFAVTEHLSTRIDEIASELEVRVGKVAGRALRLVADERGIDAVAGGLVLETLWNPRQQPSQPVLLARARVESWLVDGSLPDPEVGAWSRAAVAAIRHYEDRGQLPQAQRWLDRAEEVLATYDAIELSAGSSVLRIGFDARLSQLGHALGAFLDDPSSEALATIKDHLRYVGDHQRARTDDGADRLARAEMALRLCRHHLHDSSLADPSFAGRARHFVHDGAWVDYARDVLGEGETVFSVAEIYGRLLASADELRGSRDLAFAQALAEWSKVLPTSSDSTRPIERVLDEVLAPIAAHHPVLFLVLDGLSHPEALKLHHDLRDLGWRSRTPGGEAFPPVVAAFPTVTQVSRVSLLSGILQEGGQKEESEGFAARSSLLEAAPGSTPVLFHKKDLNVEGGQIAGEVRNAILDPEQRIVGAVVNAVDDHLDKGQQLRLADGVRALRLLRPLLDAASEANRIVIVISDHGHVLDYGSEYRAAEGGGERWRPADGEPAADEVRIEGPRVVRGDGAVILPATEGTRYMTARKRGYHGGATPQEVLCPLVALFPGGVALEGWESSIAYPPAWWTGDEEITVPTPVAAPSVPEAVVEPDGQRTFISAAGDVVASDAPSDWVTELLASSLWQEQRSGSGRAALDDATSATLLRTLHAAGGTAAGAGLAKATGTSTMRLRGQLEALKQIVNLDGYPVLTIDPDNTARLNRALLFEQFGLSE